MTTQIILTPAADHHRTGRAWQALQRECLRQLAPAEVTIAETAAEAQQAAKASALKGHQKMIAVGDGRTAHGMVNGVMELAESHRRNLALGFFSLTRPGEWARTIDFPTRIKRQLEVLKAGHTVPFDLGRVDCLDEQGRPVARYFLNGAGFGLTGKLRHEWAGLRASPPGAVGGVMRALGDFLLHKHPVVRLEGNPGVLYEGPCSLGMVMAGRFYPVLGEIAPLASPTDGELDALWVGGQSLWQALAQWVRLVAPGARPASGAGAARGAAFRASSPERVVFLEADGQVVGRLPATFSVVPRALPVIVPQVGQRLKRARFAPLPAIGEGALAGNPKTRAG